MAGHDTILSILWPRAYPGTHGVKPAFRSPSVPQTRRRQFRTLHQRAQLTEGDRVVHPSGVADEGGEPTIGAGDDPLAADDIRVLADALGHQLWVLHIVGAGVDHA